ncbi:HTH-type transcriptional regulator DmlR (fragment) [Xenorhabdus cabanillasii JM26]|uniref:HTH-type transcriptional regulator DmlR n=1 Tax=Xenorhabdus cabanillasii JM26 TaxID=1427517 RepID=W1J8A0_9GAMM
MAKRASFVAVAEEIGASPAFISKRIAILENVLNVSLLHRTTRRVSITEDGERIYEWAQHILNDVNQMLDELSELRQEPQGKIRITSSFGFGRKFVAPAYLARNPMPKSINELPSHACLVIKERDHPFGIWKLQNSTGTQSVKVTGPMSSNHVEIIHQWCLDGHGITLRSYWDVRENIKSGALIHISA